MLAESPSNLPEIFVLNRRPCLEISRSLPARRRDFSALALLMAVFPGLLLAGRAAASVDRLPPFFHEDFESFRTRKS
jgi:hypothetical protein